MEDLTELPQITWNLFGLNVVLNTETIIMTWIVMASLILFAYLATRKISFSPNPFQVVAELIVNAFYGLTRDALDEEMANMIKYQHGYSAAARFVTEIDRMIDKIINRMGV